MILGGFQALTFLDYPARMAGWNGGQETVADTAVSDCGSGMQARLHPGTLFGQNRETPGLVRYTLGE